MSKQIKIYQIYNKDIKKEKVYQGLSRAFTAALFLICGGIGIEQYAGISSPAQAEVVGEHWSSMGAHWYKHVSLKIESGPYKGQIADDNIGSLLYSWTSPTYKVGEQVNADIRLSPILKKLRARNAVPLSSQATSSKPKL